MGECSTILQVIVLFYDLHLRIERLPKYFLFLFTSKGNKSTFESNIFLHTFIVSNVASTFHF